jgi:hypothetical protein
MAGLFDVIQSTLDVGGGPRMPEEQPRMSAPQRETFQRPRGFRNTVGQILDAVALMGGAQPGYRTAVNEQEKRFNIEQERGMQDQQRQQFQNALANAMRNPTDPEALIPLAQMEGGLTAAKTVRDIAAPQERTGSLSDVQFTFRQLVDSGMSPQEALPRAFQLSQKPAAPGRPIATAEGYVAPEDAIGKMPYRAPPAASRGGGAAANVQQGRVSRPFTPEDYAEYGVDPSVPMVFDRFGQAKALGGVNTVAEGGRGGLTATQFAQAKGRAAKLPTLISQLDRLDSSIDTLNKSTATGPIGGRIPEGFSEAADVFEATLGQVRATIRSLTRIAGEGSISDFETRLNNALLPSRTQTAEGRREAAANLRALAADLQSEYQAMVSGGLSAPGAAQRNRQTPAADGGFKVLRRRPAGGQ